MIPLNTVRENLEKTSGVLGNVAKFVLEHPKTTLGILGGIAAADLIARAFNKNLGQEVALGNIINASNQSKQNNYLKQIAGAVAKSPEPKVAPEDIPIVVPRSFLY